MNQKFYPVEELRKAYEEAEKNNKETFMFHGHELVVGYAKYLLQYLDSMNQKHFSFTTK